MSEQNEQKVKTIYDLDLHEYLNISSWITVHRVPGGWIYVFACPPEEGNDFGVFVPLDYEFQSKQE